MAKIAIFSVPAFGHVNPILPIAAELVRRGHAVTIFNEAGFEALSRSTGADFVAYHAALRHDDFARTLKDGDLVRWMQMIFLRTGPVLGGVVRHLRSNRPDVLVFDGVALWGEMAAAKLRLRSVSISTTFIFEVFRDLDSLSEWLGYMKSVAIHLPGFVWGWLKMMLRTILGLPWRLPLAPRQGNRTLVLTSRAVHPPSPFFENPKFAFLGCSIDPATRPEAFDFSRLDGRPLVYVSLGTLITDDSGFFDRCVEAFADFPGQVLLSTGKGADRSRLGALPANFIAAESVPQLRVLERTSVFLTAAGLNSMHESLWYGVPMVAVPRQFEQLRNAVSMSRAGAGIALTDEAYGRRVSATALRDAVTAIIDGHAGYSGKAQALGQTLRDAGGFRAVADEIEAVAAAPGRG